MFHKSTSPVVTVRNVKMCTVGWKGVAFEPPSIMATQTTQFLLRRVPFISLYYNIQRHAQVGYELFRVRDK